jgi:glycerate kinase
VTLPSGVNADACVADFEDGVLTLKLPKVEAAKVEAPKVEAPKVPAGPINDLGQVFADPQVRSRGMVAQVAHPRRRSLELVASPIKLSATPAQVRMLTGRLERLVQMYRSEFGVDVSDIEGAGAAGGLAGALAALGGKLVPGFELVADELDLHDTLRTADLIITGEGHMDAQSFAGKVVGNVLDLGRSMGTPVGAVVGDADDDVLGRLPTVRLVEMFGLEQALAEPLRCIEQAAKHLIEQMTGVTAP